MMFNTFRNLVEIVTGKEKKVCLFEKEILSAIAMECPKNISKNILYQIDCFNHINHLDDNRSTLFYSRFRGKNNINSEYLLQNLPTEFVLGIVTIRNYSGSTISASVHVVEGQVFEIEYSSSPLKFFEKGFFREIKFFEIKISGVFL